jgi:excinuclease ABC subunit C
MTRTTRTTRTTRQTRQTHRTHKTRKTKNKMHFSIAGQPVHPHIKLTNEDFPRPLATRILRDDGDEYFGAFLNRTNVRILIDFLNRTFRLRSCAIEIDGSFPVPCTQYYAKRCVAPCVASLCARESYLEIVDLVRLFLRNDRELFLATVTKKIETAASALDFETAAFFRDMLRDVESFWSKPRWQVWLDDAVDTFELDVRDDVFYVIVLTQRGRRSLGDVVFAFPNSAGIDPTMALGDVIDQFYVHHLPREIRVSDEFKGRAALAKKLAMRFGPKIVISVAGDDNRRVTAERAVDLTRARLAMEITKGSPTTAELQDELVEAFALDHRPMRIEAFDAAHISATGFAAAVAVWSDGKELPEEYGHWLSDRTSELDTLRAFVGGRVVRTKPDLILVDGGRSHLRAALDGVEKAGFDATVIAAVKPGGKHSSISHFLTADNARIEFDLDKHSHRLLKRLRDDAHDLANATHRLGRDMMHFYELASILPSLNERERQELLREFGSIRTITSLDGAEFVKRFGKKKAAAVERDLTAFRNGRSPAPEPLIVPIRFVETDGAAEDLIPIETR